MPDREETEAHILAGCAALKATQFKARHDQGAWQGVGLVLCLLLHLPPTHPCVPHTGYLEDDDLLFVAIRSGRLSMCGIATSINSFLLVVPTADMAKRRLGTRSQSHPDGIWNFGRRGIP